MRLLLILHMVILECLMRKIAEIRAHFPDRTLIAGNIATAEGTCLYEAGVDVVKVGIGQVLSVLLV